MRTQFLFALFIAYALSLQLKDPSREIPSGRPPGTLLINELSSFSGILSYRIATTAPGPIFVIYLLGKTAYDYYLNESQINAYFIAGCFVSNLESQQIDGSCAIGETFNLTNNDLAPFYFVIMKNTDINPERRLIVSFELNFTAGMIVDQSNSPGSSSPIARNYDNSSSENNCITFFCWFWPMMVITAVVMAAIIAVVIICNMWRTRNDNYERTEQVKE